MLSLRLEASPVQVLYSAMLRSPAMGTGHSVAACESTATDASTSVGSLDRHRHQLGTPTGSADPVTASDL